MIKMADNARIDRMTSIDDADLDDLCKATDDAILDGNGFGWLRPPPRATLKRYWRGVVLVPERELYVARLDGGIVGSAQLLRPPANNEAGGHAATLTTFFIAPWARGHGLARNLLRTVENSARTHGFRLLDLDVRATQEAAIQLCQNFGFIRWGVKEKYALVNGQYVAGFYFSKTLLPEQSGPDRQADGGDAQQRRSQAEQAERS